METFCTTSAEKDPLPLSLMDAEGFMTKIWFVKTVIRTHTENHGYRANQKAKSNHILHLPWFHQKQAGELVYEGKSQGNNKCLLWILRMNLNFVLKG